MTNAFAESTGQTFPFVNISCGWVEPSDMREIKYLASQLDAKIILFPDTSDVLDAPQTGKLQFYPKGGVTIDELKMTGDSKFTIALGHFCAEEAAKVLDAKCRVPYSTQDIPIGVKATDRFIMELADKAGADIPDSVTDDRGRLVDIITDMQQYFHGKRVALFGDPDTLIPLVEFLVDIDMKPVYIVSGTGGKYFEKRIREIAEPAVPELKVKNGPQADMFMLHQWIKNEPADLLIGNTYGKYIARDEDIPFIRFGFPILDRIGHSYFPSVGYRGGMHLLEKILGALLDRKDRDASEETFELVM